MGTRPMTTEKNDRSPLRKINSPKKGKTELASRLRKPGRLFLAHAAGIVPDILRASLPSYERLPRLLEVFWGIKHKIHLLEWNFFLAAATTQQDSPDQHIERP